MPDSSAQTFVDLLHREYSWPETGDNPFVSPNSHEGHADLRPWWGSAAYFISDGFMEAGEHLLEKAIATPSSRQMLILPILFCFRHAIETSLKRIISDHGERYNVSCDKLNSTHNLEHLWGCFGRIMDVTTSEAEQTGVAAAGEIVRAFHQWDAGSYAFRYTNTSRGQPVSFPEASIDLLRLRGTMKKLAHFFVGADSALIELRDTAEY